MQGERFEGVPPVEDFNLVIRISLYKQQNLKLGKVKRLTTHSSQFKSPTLRWLYSKVPILNAGGCCFTGFK